MGTDSINSLLAVLERTENQNLVKLLRLLSLLNSGENSAIFTNLSVNTITEKTSGSGVTVDGLLIKDGAATFLGVNSYFTEIGIEADTNQDQTNATQLNAEYNIVDVVDNGGDAVKLISCALNKTQVVKNTSTNILAVFPSSGDSIDSMSSNEAILLNPQELLFFVPNTETNWVSSKSYYVEALNSIILKADDDLGYGKLRILYKKATVTFSGGGTETIDIKIPANSKIVGTLLRNDTLLVGAGATSYSAAYSGGSLQSICSGTSFSKNTKINTLFDTNSNSDITTAETAIVITPDAGTLDTGKITAVTYYIKMDNLTDAP